MATKTLRESSFIDPTVVYTSIPDAILEDLCSRFLINLPSEDKDDMVRVFFQIEQAHWYYIDFYCQEQNLPSYGLKEFSKIIFEKFPFLNKSNQTIDKLMNTWKKYKFSVPVYGAILLNSELDKCVLVQAFTNKPTWGFPRGKLNKEESAYECSIREVRLYIVQNVPIDTEFKTRTRGEIKDIQWFNIKDLPVHKKDSRMKDTIGLSANNFFMVTPFMKELKKWISEKRSMVSLEEETRNSHPQAQLQRLLQSEEARLSIENTRVNEERRKEEAQKKFLHQMAVYHPLSPIENRKSVKAGFGKTARKQAKFPSEHPDTRQTSGPVSFKILKRSETGRRNSPDGRRDLSRSSLSPSAIQESQLSHTRTLSPSKNSAFTRVSRTKNARPSRQNNLLFSKSSAIFKGFRIAPSAWLNFRFDKKLFFEALKN
ncbi:mRNA decapping complex subunit 2-like isoform X2 [Xenia sp. Carnegie-2017]|uniref:mRNA decapping complex subunit 2-like isoform X2 n=1 Tax=Xenia sp. Carnegie-2017 TaxID=2897299 RepID=UPI001F046247|nr:mRNA decapping complex subunit 2-like isoform X2 [Xenia sp. Carnegie-2017]